MIGRRVCVLAGLAALLSIKVHAQGSKSVTVRVLTDGQNCIVYTQKMSCDAVPAFLRDNRHLDFSQPISVIPDGNGEDSRARGLKTSRYLTQAGYSKVVVVDFLTEPGSASSTRP
jgi:hypothetical protein